jgi:hypothetical protein
MHIEFWLEQNGLTGGPRRCLKDNTDWLTYLLTYLLRYSMVQNIIWKADCHSAYEKIYCLLSLWTLKVHHRVHKRRHWILSWASWSQFAPSIPITHRSGSMLSSHLRLRLPSGLTFGPPYQNPVNTSPLHHASHMSRPPYPPLFNHPNNIQGRIQAMEFLITQFFHHPCMELTRNTNTKRALCVLTFLRTLCIIRTELSLVMSCGSRYVQWISCNHNVNMSAPLSDSTTVDQRDVMILLWSERIKPSEFRRIMLAETVLWKGRCIKGCKGSKVAQKLPSKHFTNGGLF